LAGLAVHIRGVASIPFRPAPPANWLRDVVNIEAREQRCSRIS